MSENARGLRAQAPVDGPGAVLFDVEGVIAFPDHLALARGLKAIDPSLDPQALADLRHRVDLYPLWEQFSRGELASQAYWAAVLGAAGLPSDAATTAAMARLQAAATWAELDPDVLALADVLRAAGWRTGLLSNSCADYEPQIQRFAPCFDTAHFSHRTGLRKPDAAAYLAAAQALSAQPTAIIFIDDKARNIEAAARLGMKAHLYRGIASLREALPELGAGPT